MARCGEGGDAWTGPDKSESASHFDFALVADSDVVDVAFDHRRDFAFFHACPDVVAGVLHANGGQFVSQAHALDFLGSLDHAHLSEKRRGVNGFFAGSTKGIVKTLPVHGGLADHAIAYLRILRQLNAYAAGTGLLFQYVHGHFDGADHWRRVFLCVTKRERKDVSVSPCVSR